MDNLSTVNKLPGPNVSFIERFHCSCIEILMETSELSTLKRNIVQHYLLSIEGGCARESSRAGTDLRPLKEPLDLVRKCVMSLN